MDYIYRLPFIFSSISTILVGLIGYANNENCSRLYIKMSICILLTYLLGVYLRSIINRTIREVDQSSRDKEEQQREQKQKEKDKEHSGDIGEKGMPTKGSGIDILIDDSNDEFKPLKISEIIKSSLKEDEFK